MNGSPLPATPDVDVWESELGKFDDFEPLPESGPDETAENVAPTQPRAIACLDRSLLVPASVLVTEGRRLIAKGIQYVWEGIIPRYGMLGFWVAYAKTGKTTTALPLVKAISRGDEFLGRPTSKSRALWLALEDPREYTAWLAARTLDGTEDITFYPASLSLTEPVLADIEALIRDESIGFVYVSTFMHGVREMVKDENDNAGLARVVESLKASARRVGVPHLFEAHSGKGEDQSPEADPAKALRGASAAAAAADFVLSLKRDGRGLTTQRVISGSGRFVNFPPLSFDYDASTGALSYLGAQKDAGTETTIRLIRETGAVVMGEPRSVSAIIRAAGGSDKGPTRAMYRCALERMPDVQKTSSPGQGGKTTRYELVALEAEA